MNYEDRVTKEYVENALAAKCGVVCGTYNGEYENTSFGNPRTISLGFRPKAVIVMAESNYYGELEALPVQLASDGAADTCLAVVDDGFAVSYALNYSGRSPFHYIAFR